MSRKLALLIIVVMIAAGLSVYAKGEEKMGWIDSDTYRTRGVGELMENQKKLDKGKRKAIACESASLTAMSMMSIQFAGTESKMVKTKLKKVSEGNKSTESVSGKVEGLRMISEKFDAGKNTCEVVLELKEKGLREKARKRSGK